MLSYFSSFLKFSGVLRACISRMQRILKLICNFHIQPNRGTTGEGHLIMVHSQIRVAKTLNTQVPQLTHFASIGQLNRCCELI